MSTKFLSPGWRMPRNANQSKSANYSLDFNGSSDYIDIVNSSAAPASLQSLGNSNSYSISAWINTTTTVVIPDGANYYWFALSTILELRNEGTTGIHAPFNLSVNGGKLFFGRTSNYTTSSEKYESTTNVNTGAWVHCIATVDNNTLKFYINGSLDSTHTFTTATGDCSVGSNTANFFIGSRSTDGGGNDAYFNGKIANVLIFDYELSSSQITTLYGDSTNGPGNPMALPSPPKAYYPLGTSAWNGEYLSENNAIGDYVFDFIPSDYIDCGTGLGNTLGSSVSDMTVSLWYKNQTGSNEGLFTIMSSITSETTAPFAISYSNTNNSIYVWFGSTDYNYYSRTLDSNWHHLSIVKNGTSLTTYIDGSSVSPSGTVGSIPATIDTTNKKTFIGVYYSDSFTYNGSLSNAQVFNTALSSTDIETLYNYGSPIRTLANIPQSSNLKAWYKLDASEIYNSSSTEWEVNNAVSSYNNSLFVDNVFGNTSINGITMGSYSDTAGLSAISWSLWVNLKVLNSASGYSTLINGNSFSFSTDASNGGLNWKSRFVTTSNIDNDFTLSTALQSQGWVNIIATYDGTNAKFYLNTAEQGTQTGSGVLNTTSSLNLAYSYGSNSVDAYFSNFSIWNKALTTSDISEIYNSGVPGDLASHSSTSNLINWWKLNNLSSGLQDSKGSSNATTTGTSGSTTVQPGSVSTLNGLSSGMNQSNLVQSDLQTVAPYSKYAMNFDGVNDWINIPSFMSSLPSNDIYTISTWVKTSVDTACLWGSSNTGSALLYAFVQSGTTLGIARGSVSRVDISNSLSVGEWANVVAVFDTSTNLKIYINNVFIQDATVGSLGAVTDDFKISGGLNAYPLNCSQSNVSIWNTALTSAQVSEIYNEGLPGDLNSHSAYSNLISWWQLGENSSFDGNDWICADEKGNNNGVSNGMALDDLTNGVGTTSNGVSTGMSEDNLVGNAPYSAANAISSGMALTARGPNVP